MRVKAAMAIGAAATGVCEIESECAIVAGELRADAFSAVRDTRKAVP
jgi:transcription elongation factor Elf1